MSGQLNKMSVRSRVICPKYDQIVSNQKAKSGIWQYFGLPGDISGKIITENIGVCTICKCAISSKATSNLWSHLKCHHPLQYYNENRNLRKKMESKDPTLAQPSPKPGIPQNKKPETQYGDSNRTPTKPCENDEFEMSGRRIVNISYFFQQLMQLNKHGPPGCSLNNMRIVAETRRGLASEIKVKCSKCSFEKRIWTEDVSSQLPLNLNTAAVTGTIGIRNGLSAMEEFLDVLNVSSVSINTTYAAKRDAKVPSSWDSPQKEMQQAVKQSATKQEDTETEGFCVVVKGTWAKKTHAVARSGESSEKPPEVVVLDTKPDVEFMDLEPTPLLATVTPTDNVADLNLRTEATSEVILPDLSEPGPSSRRGRNITMAEQDVDMAMTCDSYPVHVSQRGSVPKIKEEPIDSDTCSRDSSTSVEQENDNFPKDSSLTSDQKGSLFHPPVLIKEEPVYFEEQS